MASDGKGREFFLYRYEELGETVSLIKLKPVIRVNTLKISPEKLLKRLKEKGVKLKKIPWLKNSYTVEESKFSLGSTPEFLLGKYYIQEAAAQSAVEILDPRPGETVLDCCASPGGKTTHIAQLMENKGELFAFELKDERIMALKSNLERMGITNCIAYSMDARRVEDIEVKFDKILIDAPCSGNFILDKNWFKRRDIEGIRRSSRIQKKIIESCMKVLKKGGALVYSTCSLEPEENELNIQWLLDKYDVKLEKINIGIGSPGLTKVFGEELNKEISKCIRFWPNKTGTQGFFAAKVIK